VGMEVCKYCGGEAFFKLKNGSYCCKESHNKCPALRIKNSVSLTGRKRDPDLMKRIGLKQRGKIFSKEHKDKLSKIWKGRKHKPETIEKMKIIATGRFPTDETRKKLREYWKNKNLGCLNPNWRGGTSRDPYCFEFDIILKEYIMERDNFKCKNPLCKSISKRLCVHHIDYNKKNCEESNLITLCGSCHSKSNFNRNEWEKRLKEL
jgi:hypothetical protein